MAMVPCLGLLRHGRLLPPDSARLKCSLRFSAGQNFWNDLKTPPLMVVLRADSYLLTRCLDQFIRAPSGEAQGSLKPRLKRFQFNAAPTAFDYGQDDREAETTTTLASMTPKATRHVCELIPGNPGASVYHAESCRSPAGRHP